VKGPASKARKLKRLDAWSVLKKYKKANYGTSDTFLSEAVLGSAMQRTDGDPYRAILQLGAIEGLSCVFSSSF
jgi:hypothetical protein